MKAPALILGIVAALAALAVTPAAAQYPAPLGVCQVSAGSANAPANSTVTFTVSVMNSDGSGAPGVQGTASIASQPGTGAQVLTPNFTTDAQGKASIQVQTGNTAGQITLAVTCGTLNASSVVSVVSAAPAVTPRPPVTGDGSATAAADGGTSMLWISLGAVAVAATGAGATVALRRR